MVQTASDTLAFANLDAFLPRSRVNQRIAKKSEEEREKFQTDAGGERSTTVSISA